MQEFGGCAEDMCGCGRRLGSGEHPTFSGDDGVKFKGGAKHEEAAGSEMWRRVSGQVVMGASSSQPDARRRVVKGRQPGQGTRLIPAGWPTLGRWAMGVEDGVSAMACRRVRRRPCRGAFAPVTVWVPRAASMLLEWAPNFPMGASGSPFALASDCCVVGRRRMASRRASSHRWIDGVSSM